MTLPRKIKDHLLTRSLSTKERSLDDLTNLSGSYPMEGNRYLRADPVKFQERRRKRSHTIDFGQMMEVQGMVSYFVLPIIIPTLATSELTSSPIGSIDRIHT